MVLFVKPRPHYAGAEEANQCEKGPDSESLNSATHGVVPLSPQETAQTRTYGRRKAKIYVIYAMCVHNQHLPSLYFLNHLFLMCLSVRYVENGCYSVHPMLSRFDATLSSD